MTTPVILKCVLKRLIQRSESTAALKRSPQTASCAVFTAVGVAHIWRQVANSELTNGSFLILTCATNLPNTKHQLVCWDEVDFKHTLLATFPKCRKIQPQSSSRSNITAAETPSRAHEGTSGSVNYFKLKVPHRNLLIPFSWLAAFLIHLRFHSQNWYFEPHCDLCSD